MRNITAPRTVSFEEALSEALDDLAAKLNK